MHRWSYKLRFLPHSSKIEIHLSLILDGKSILGQPIDFDLELPWLDSKNPMTVKFLRFVAMATKGDAKFFISAYVDNLYKNHDGEVVFRS